MARRDRFDRLFVATSLLIQVALVAFFALVKWNFAAAMQMGWIVYALAVPAAVVSGILMRAGKPWYLCLAGVLFAAWAIFGTAVDLVWAVQWREPILWPVFVPYVALYTASLMFYWWPLLRVHRASWFVYAALYVTSTLLNVTSHGWS
jgi:hypothetical protein